MLVKCRTKFSQLFVIYLETIFLYNYILDTTTLSFLPYINKFLVPIGKKPAHCDHESDDKNLFLRLTSLIPILT